jgi:cbb3-type cytochrome oxidase maturation protein
MTILIVMIPLSILLLIGAGIAFFWAVDHDQFDDMQTPALLPLLDPPDAVEAPDAADTGAPPDPATKPPR